MKIKIFSLLIAFSLLLSCNVNTCDYYCNSGPLSLYFVLLNKESGENLFTNGTYQLENLEVLDLDNSNAAIPFNFNIEEDLNQLAIGSFGYEINEANYAITINSETIFSISLNTEETRDACCSAISLKDFKLNGAEYNLNETTGVYEVLIDI